MQFTMCVLSSLIFKYFHTSEADIVSAAAAGVSLHGNSVHVRYRSLVSGVFLRVQVHELGIGPDTDTSILSLINAVELSFLSSC